MNVQGLQLEICGAVLFLNNIKTKFVFMGGWLIIKTRSEGSEQSDSDDVPLRISQSMR